MKITLESFLAVLKRSGLIAADRLKPLLNEFQQSGGGSADGRPFADWLVAKSLLTPWQADKLLQGKHKGFFLGKYRLLDLLGKGGMSSVYLAEHVLMRRRCAIKVLPAKKVKDTSYLGRFHREAQAVASLDHPNIVRAYDVDHEQDGEIEIHFLVMEFVDGSSLHELVNREGPLDVVRAAEYIRQAALGLEHAHKAGLIHRDIKPGNLLVDGTGLVKVMDLGLARFFAGQDEESLTLQYDEKVLGTADYLAPEQAVDSHAIDARADIYSLGCTFYFLLTGHPPFTEGTLPQRLMAHQSKEPHPVEADRKDVPASLLAILKRMMAKVPAERLATAAAVADELGAWLQEHGGQQWATLRAAIPDAPADSASGISRSAVLKKPVVLPPASSPAVGSQQVGVKTGSAKSAGDEALGSFLTQLAASESQFEPTIVTTASRTTAASKPVAEPAGSPVLRTPAAPATKKPAPVPQSRAARVDAVPVVEAEVVPHALTAEPVAVAEAEAIVSGSSVRLARSRKKSGSRTVLIASLAGGGLLLAGVAIAVFVAGGDDPPAQVAANPRARRPRRPGSVRSPSPPPRSASAPKATSPPLPRRRPIRPNTLRSTAMNSDSSRWPAARPIPSGSSSRTGPSATCRLSPKAAPNRSSSPPASSR
jgi:serine/threonine protein kinase